MLNTRTVGVGFSPGIPSRAARGLLGSEADSNMEFGTQTLAEQKITLRTYFARYFDDGMTKEDVENWFDTLGACTGKGEISDNKEKLTAYLMQTKGFSTGEDFVLSLSSDIDGANADMQCGLIRRQQPGRSTATWRPRATRSQQSKH